MTDREKQIEVLLSRLCTKLGFCLPSAEIARLKDSPPMTAAEFTRAIFEAEGLNPDHADRHLVRQVQRLVIQAFSSDAT